MSNTGRLAWRLIGGRGGGGAWASLLGSGVRAGDTIPTRGEDIFTGDGAMRILRQAGGTQPPLRPEDSAAVLGAAGAADTADTYLPSGPAGAAN